LLIMIKYDLNCALGHRFEGWFRSSADFEEQTAAGQLSCPDCGSGEVRKGIMAPRLGKGTPSPEAMAEVRNKLKELRQQVETNCDYVGPRFAEEARKIHYGETEARGIYGETKPEDAKALKDEGIAFSAIPWLPKENA